MTMVPKCCDFVFLGCQAFVQLYYVVQEFHLVHTKCHTMKRFDNHDDIVNVTG